MAVSAQGSVPRAERVALVLTSVLVVLLGVLLWLAEHAFGDQRRHHAQLQRVEHWVGVTRAFPPRGVDQQDWSQGLTAVHNSLYNVMDRPQHIPTARVRALADHFDRTHAVELGSMAELLGFIVYLEEICPNAKDYGPFDYLRRSYPGVKPVRFAPPVSVP